MPSSGGWTRSGPDSCRLALRRRPAGGQDETKFVYRMLRAPSPENMRQSRAFIFTLREVPRDADVVSQQLMMRAGMIRKVAAGIYDYLPLALRSIRKFESIV